MHVLITGGAGFIGSHLAEWCLESGDRVTILDDFSSGDPLNLGVVAKARLARVYHGSVTDRALVSRLVARADIVYHLAALVGVRRNLMDPVAAVQINVVGSRIVMEEAARRGVPVLITSSSEVYGDRNTAPFRESDSLLIGPPNSPRHIYASTKLMEEHMGLAYHRQAGLPVIITRLFNVVGPRQSIRQGMVLPSFISQALGNREITVYGDGNQTRTICHVRDAVIVLRRLATHAHTPGQVYNVGGTREFTMTQLAEMVKRCTKSKSRIRYTPYAEAYPPGFMDYRRRAPDLKKLRSLLGEVDLRPPRETIVSAVQYYGGLNGSG